MGHYANNHEVTYSLIDGTGALGEPQYFWWKDVTAEHTDPGDGTVPKDWRLRITSVNPEDPEDEDESGKFPPFVTEIDHAKVVEAVSGILKGRFTDPDKLPEKRTAVAGGTVDHCRKLVDDPEYGYLAWDAWVSDELLQVIVYGGVIW
ncbi:hypothetical protein SEA_SATIS_301 [Streptomyces phage Satis]|nr:hypothetical protein SEA_SATIS_301 [Streptomyces phage Satis]